MKRRDCLALLLTPVILSCSQGTSKKISTDKTLLGDIVYSDSRGDYHMQSEHTNRIPGSAAFSVVIITSKKDYETLDKLKGSGVDSIEVKLSNINFSYQGKGYKSYFIKK